MKILTTTLFLLLTCTILHAQQPINGIYKINTTKTQFGEAPQWSLPLSLKLSDAHGKITIIRHIADQSGSESDRTLNFGTGTTAAYSSPSGAQNKATLQWTAGHASLVLNNTSTGLSFKETWSLADNGQTLVVDRHVEQPDGMQYDIKAYYDKQP